MVVNIKRPGKVNCFRGGWLWSLAGQGICYLCSSILQTGDLFICTACNNDLPRNLRSCRICALPVTGNGTICGSCLEARPRHVACTFALFRYMFPLNRLIHDLKFHHRVEIAAFLGGQMARFAREQGLSMPQCLIPVPLHRSRVADRGYNQALEIARAIAGRLGLPVCHGLCNRTINTLPQTTVAAAFREANLNGAFALSGRIKVLPDHVVLVDDVVTSGATVHELARVLRGGGIKRVDVWAAARAG